MSPSNAVPAPPIDVPTFRARSHRIWEAREKARQDFEQQGLKEADAENAYQRQRALALAKHRKEGASWAAAEKLAEGDAADHRLERDTARVLKRSAEFRMAELERNASMLRAEATMSEGI